MSTTIPFLSQMILVGLVLLYMALYSIAIKDPKVQEKIRRKTHEEMMSQDPSRVYMKRFMVGLVFAMSVLVMPYVVLAVVAFIRYCIAIDQHIGGGR